MYAVGLQLPGPVLLVVNTSFSSNGAFFFATFRYFVTSGVTVAASLDDHCRSCLALSATTLYLGLGSPL